MDNYFELYRQHNAEVKQIPNDICEKYANDWAWQNLGECLIGSHSHVGFWFGILAPIIWIPAEIVTYLEIHGIHSNHISNLVIFTAFIHFLSGTGTFLSLQSIVVIWFDLCTLCVELMMLLLILGFVIKMRTQNKQHYQNMGKHVVTVTKIDEDRHLIDRSWRKQTHQFHSPTSCKIFCFIPVVGLLALLMIYDERIIDAQEKDKTSFIQSGLNASLSEESRWVVMMIISGYLLGCLACFAQWWKDVHYLTTLQNYSNEESPRKTFKFLAATSLFSTIFFLFAVLIQSRGLRVTIVTLPWLVLRIVSGWFQTIRFYCPNWLLQFSSSNQNDSASDLAMEDIDADVISLIHSSDSENSHVLWESGWRKKLTTTHQIYDVGNTQYLQVPNSRVRRLQDKGINISTTTDSNLSTTSHEQELEWENEIATDKTHKRQKDTNTNKSVFPLRLSPLVPDVISTTPDQKVRSWMSQSTPDTEIPPCLTLTLNLDSPPDPRMSHTFFCDAKHSPGWSSPRKNSF